MHSIDTSIATNERPVRTLANETQPALPQTHTTPAPVYAAPSLHERHIIPLHVGLEQRLSSACFCPVDVYSTIDFNDFLSPNEWNSSDAAPYIRQAQEPGLIVSTGTKRCFSDLELLLQTSPEKCRGLVARDINPRAKAYVDFITLLLRTAENREDFARCFSAELIQNLQENFSPFRSGEKIDTEKLQAFKQNLLASPTGKQLIADIRKKIIESSMPGNVKDYYLHHIEDFVALFYSTDLAWLHLPGLQGFECLHNDDLFLDMQKLAQAGNVIATIGDITDLRFLEEEKVHSVDISNIPSYIRIHMKLHPRSHPNIIWTSRNIKHPFPSSNYTAYTVTFNGCSREQMMHDDALSTICHALAESQRITGKDTLTEAIKHFIPDRQLHDIHPVTGPHEKAKHILANYHEQHLLHTEALGWICLDKERLYCLERLNELNHDALVQLTEDPNIAKFLDVLVQASDVLNMETFLAFSSIPGWQEAFFKAVIEDSDALMGFDSKTSLFCMLHEYLKRHPASRELLPMDESSLQAYYDAHLREIRSTTPQDRSTCFPQYIENLEKVESYLRENPSFGNRPLA